VTIFWSVPGYEKLETEREAVMLSKMSNSSSSSKSLKLSLELVNHELLSLLPSKLSPWSRVLEKLIIALLVKFPAF
jgi:hypothetical protein